ncbi:hypothetical protein ACKFRV_06045 [Corynebacterium amycolatum]|uniref:hypothetical protein n=1 Tax=Corynebacterium amycolatum TaxID=43765 RepID=UPI0038CF686C
MIDLDKAICNNRTMMITFPEAVFCYQDREQYTQAVLKLNMLIFGFASGISDAVPQMTLEELEAYLPAPQQLVTL